VAPKIEEVVKKTNEAINKVAPKIEEAVNKTNEAINKVVPKFEDAVKKTNEVFEHFSNEDLNEIKAATSDLWSSVKNLFADN